MTRQIGPVPGVLPMAFVQGVPVVAQSLPHKSAISIESISNDQTAHARYGNQQ